VHVASLTGAARRCAGINAVIFFAPILFRCALLVVAQSVKSF